MDILYTCDNNYVWLMGTSMLSLFENNKNLSNITVYLLGENISKENKTLLENIANEYKRKCIVIDMPEIYIPDNLVSARWPKSAFSRLYAGEILPDELDRILYLDCDTIISGSISDLEKLDIADKYIFGVKDCIGKLYKKNIGLSVNDIYINAGVLLMNLDKLRKLSLGNLIDEYLKTYFPFINYADQDVLNGILIGKIGVLSPKYDVMTIDFAHSYDEIKRLRRPKNFYSEAELSEAVLTPVVIHYTTNMKVIRPWYENSDHPQKEEFRRYWENSPWKNSKLEQMLFKSKEAKLISLIEKLPRKMSCTVLGILHSVLRPLYIRAKARIILNESVYSNSSIQCRKKPR